VLRVAACAVVSLAVAAVVLRALEVWARRRPRSVGWYVAVQWVGTIVLAVFSIVPALLIVGDAWAVFVAGPLLLGPFIAWDVAGIRRARAARGG
jgi:hypothetical protein